VLKSATTFVNGEKRIMPAIKFCKLACIAATAIFLSAPAYATDLATLQSAVAYAQDNMEKAKFAHQTDVQEVQRQQQMVADQKKKLEEQTRQLNEAQKNTEQAWQQYLLAKAKYEKAQSALDAAWNKK
jgi:hypothetical protein